MQPFGHILVPTDFSTCSDAALDAAVLLARTCGAELTVIHVVDLGEPNLAGNTFVPDPDRLARAEDRARLAVAQVGSSLVVRSVTRVGTAWREILAAGTDCRADLIVMGTHGRRGIARMFIGTTTERIVQLAPVPVLTVHAAVVPQEDAPHEPTGIEQCRMDG